MLCPPRLAKLPCYHRKKCGKKA